jgi:hypothetical protein
MNVTTQRIRATRGLPAAAAFLSLAGAVAGILGAAGGCEKGPSASPRTMSEPEAVTIGRVDDWGEDWAPGATPTADRATTSGGATWSVVLGTYSQDGHALAAANMVRDLPRIAPELAAARVHTTADGSLVVYGRYRDPQDRDAQRDLAWIKTLTFSGRQAFPRAMLTRVRSGGAGRVQHPYDLRAARARFPKVDPLYTMEVAVWGVFDSPLRVQEVQESAATYCRKLRAQGYEAYLYHDEDKQLSVVTVGLFDRTAIDQRSGFYSPQVEALFKRFPAHLVNGEPLNEPIDRERPHLGTRVQTPRLVLVPK